MERSTGVADTGFVVALLNRSDGMHNNLTTIYTQQKKILLPQTVLAEVAYLVGSNAGILNAFCVYYIENQKTRSVNFMSNYQEVLQQAQSLTPEEQIRLIEDLSNLIRQRVTVTPKPKRSILELRGLGKEIWNDIDAQEYVNQERDSWNG